MINVLFFSMWIEDTKDTKEEKKGKYYCSFW